MKKVVLLLCLVAAGLMATAQTFSSGSGNRYLGLNFIGTMLRGHTLSSHELVDQLQVVDCNDRLLSPQLGLEYLSFSGGTGWQHAFALNGNFGTQNFRGTMTDGTTLYPVDRSFPRLSLAMGYGFGYGFFDALYILATAHVGVDLLFDPQFEVAGLLDNYQLGLTAQYKLTEHILLKASATTGRYRILLTGDRLQLSDSPYVTANIDHVARIQYSVGAGLLF